MAACKAEAIPAVLSIWPSWVSYCLEAGDGIRVAGQRQQGWTVWELDPGR